MNTEPILFTPVSKYRDLKFKTKAEFLKWREQHTHMVITFDDLGQDLLEMHVDDQGEILDTNLQQAVWCGAFINIANLETFTPIYMYKPNLDEHWTRMNRLVVDSIIRKTETNEPS